MLVQGLSCLCHGQEKDPPQELRPLPPDQKDSAGAGGSRAPPTSSPQPSPSCKIPLPSVFT